MARTVVKTADFAAVFRGLVFMLPYLTEREAGKLQANVNVGAVILPSPEANKSHLK